MAGKLRRLGNLNYSHTDKWGGDFYGAPTIPYDPRRFSIGMWDYGDVRSCKMYKRLLQHLPAGLAFERCSIVRKPPTPEGGDVGFTAIKGWFIKEN